MITDVLGPGAVAHEAFGDPEEFELLPGEVSLVARAVDKRRREVTTARGLARRALADLGVGEQIPILRGEKGQPLWPRGVVGSMTHTDGYRAAVVAYALQWRSVGIDAEVHDALPEGVLDHISLPAERDVLATRPAGISWDRLLFSAKEATYKAWFPITERWLGFSDAHITFEQHTEDSGVFHSEILVDGAAVDGGAPIRTLDGRWRVGRGLVVTAIST
ncbi:4'-phosphopantetheinyl transferase [Williamsia sp. CHRR-6]|uniref:4'-phosphopantetheinyl transferase family protein n=1 Tax=Williamsia sp. CHRR-6 TaxID=2835871 RepID=UPI0035B49962